MTKLNYNKIFANCTLSLDDLFKCMIENGQMDTNIAVIKKLLEEKDDSKMEIKKGLFVKCLNDLYAGSPIYGVFHDRHIAEDFETKRKEDKNPIWDEVEIFEWDYIEINSNIYPLCNENMAIKPLGAK